MNRLLRITLLINALFSISFAQNYIVSGHAYNSFDHTAYLGATVTMMPTGGSSLYSASTLADGSYSISVPQGTYTFNISAPQKWYSETTLTVTGNVGSYDFALLDIQTGSNFEFLIFWGSQPADLDAYLLTSFSCNASYKDHSCAGPNGALAEWAYDASNGWGPESTQLRNAAIGSYEFWVNLVSASSSDNFAMSEDTRAPVAYISAPTAEPSPPTYTTITETKDPSIRWWRAIRLDVTSTSPFTYSISYPNELHSSAPATLDSSSTSTSSTSSTSTSTSTSSDSSATSTSDDGGSTSTSTSGSSSVTSTSSSSSGSSTTAYNGAGWQIPSGGDDSDNSTLVNQPGCTDAEIKYCQVQIATCTDNGQTNICPCYMHLGDCLTTYGCIDGTKKSFETECMNAGCDVTSCQSFASDATILLHSWVAIFLIVVSAIGMTQ